MYKNELRIFFTRDFIEKNKPLLDSFGYTKENFEFCYYIKPHKFKLFMNEVHKQTDEKIIMDYKCVKNFSDERLKKLDAALDIKNNIKFANINARKHYYDGTANNGKKLKPGDAEYVYPDEI